MYKRALESELEELAQGYPVVTVVGPRQSGKTTVVRKVFSKKPYVNLEAIDVQELAKSDPRGFLGRYPDGAILDEIQRVPELLRYIQVIVDERGVNGLFILTGSHQLELHHAIAQSLAGRTALLTLLPMSLPELKKAGHDLSLDEALLMGGYPRIFKENLDPTKAYRNYFQTYLERDLRQLVHVKDLSQFQRFVKICAGRIGQLANFEGIASDVGVSSKTVKEWISILEASFVLIRLMPYHENFGKRMIKSPKLYFTDVGLATYLLGIETKEQLARDPLRGNLVENLALLELMKARFNKGLDHHLYFYRDAAGKEVDFIYQSGNDLIPIEVKSSQTYHSSFTKNLTTFTSIASPRVPTGYIIYAGPNEQPLNNFHLLNIHNTHTIVQ